MGILRPKKHANTPKKYMTLENVRVFYDEKTDKIRLTSSDYRIVGGLNMIINSGRKNEIAVRNALIAEGIITNQNFQSPLPVKASIPEEAKTNPFQIPVGVGTEGAIFWTVEENVKSTLYSPHLMVAGRPGTGKTVFSNNVIDFCYSYRNDWEIVVAGLDRISLLERECTKDKMDMRTSSLEEALHLLTSLQENGGSFPKRKLVVIEEYWGLLHLSKEGTSREKKITLEILERIRILLRIGRSIGVHLLIESQIAEDTIESLGSMNLAVLVLGRLTLQDSIALFRSDLSHHSRDDIRGRGIIQTRKGLEHVQTFEEVGRPGIGN